jgi:hypothetical protein
MTLPDNMQLRPYQPSRVPFAMQKLKQQLSSGLVLPHDIDELAKLWIVALGGSPNNADECITAFVLANLACGHCRKTKKKVTVVLEGFKGAVNDGNAVLCQKCIDELL